MPRAEIDVLDRAGNPELIHCESDTLEGLQQMCALEEQSQKGKGARRVNVRMIEELKFEDSP